MNRLKSLINSPVSSYILPFFSTVLLFTLWEIAVRVFAIPQFILPAPSQIFKVAVEFGDIVLKHAGQTLMTTLIGFLLAILAGIGLGFLIGYSKLAYKSIYPLLVAFNTIPKAALVPLMVIWFGVGTIPAILTAFLLGFFPIAVNVTAGLTTVEPEMKDVLTSLGASQLEMFQKLGFPHTLPYLFASLKVAISLAFVGSVISETVASSSGIGFLIVDASSKFEIPLAFLGLFVLAAMGGILYGIFVALEYYLIPWDRV